MSRLNGCPFRWARSLELCKSRFQSLRLKCGPLALTLTAVLRSEYLDFGGGMVVSFIKRSEVDAEDVLGARLGGGAMFPFSDIIRFQTVGL